MPAITQKQMTLLVDAFCKMWMQLPTIEQRNLVLADLNDAMRDLFDDAKCNNYMFGMGKYDCQIFADQFRKHIKVTYHRRFKPKSQNGTELPWKPEFSHEIKFDKFCYQYCNPSIIHIVERVLFQRI